MNWTLLWQIVSFFTRPFFILSMTERVMGWSLIICGFVFQKIWTANRFEFDISTYICRNCFAFNVLMQCIRFIRWIQKSMTDLTKINFQQYVSLSKYHHEFEQFHWTINSQWVEMSSHSFGNFAFHLVYRIFLSSKTMGNLLHIYSYSLPCEIYNAIDSNWNFASSVHTGPIYSESTNIYGSKINKSNKIHQ